MINLLLLLISIQSRPISISAFPGSSRVTVHHVPAYRIIKESDAIIYGSVLEVHKKKTGEEHLCDWFKIKVDTVYKGKITDSVIKVSCSARGEYFKSDVGPIKKIKKSFTFPFNKDLNLIFLDKEAGEDFDYVPIYTKTLLFKHSTPESRREKMKIFKRYCSVLEIDNTLERTEELHEWYRSTENTGLRYEILEAISIESNHLSVEILSNEALKNSEEKLRKLSVEQLGKIEENGEVDSILIRTLNDSSIPVKKQALTSLGWRNRRNTIPEIRNHLNDCVISGNVVNILFSFDYFNTDSLLKIISKNSCRQEKMKSLDILKSGIMHHVFLKEKKLSGKDSEKINVIKWTPEIRDSLLSFLRFEDRGLKNKVILTLSVSGDEKLYPFFAGKVDSLRNEYLLAEEFKKKEILKNLMIYLYEIGKIDDERTVPFLLDILKKSLEKEPDDRLVAIITIKSLSNYITRPSLEISELEELRKFVDNDTVKNKLESLIKLLKKESRKKPSPLEGED